MAQNSVDAFLADEQERDRRALLEIATYNVPAHPSRANRQPRYDPEKIHKKMNSIKIKHRSSLKNPDRDWRRYNFARKFPNLRLKEVRHVQAIEAAHAAYQREREAQGLPPGCALDGPPPYATPGYTDGHPQRVSWGIDRVHWRDLTIERFIRDYERPGRPFLLTGVAEHWPAFEKWQLDNLDSSEYRDIPMKAGEDDDGNTIRVKLKYFLQYMQSQEDDSPLYIFHHLRKEANPPAAAGSVFSSASPSSTSAPTSADSDPQPGSSPTAGPKQQDSGEPPISADSMFRPSPGDCEPKKGLLADFVVPTYFRDDLYNLVGERRRPPYRWFLIGPERSGTTMHIDPLGTSAWNALLAGHKRWMLIRPNIPKRLVKREDLKKKGVDDEAISWFYYVLPKLLEEEYRRQPVDGTGHSDEDHPYLGITDCIQRPGEIIFVPGGWWHAVLNLDDTVACTQNFSSVANFDRVWRKSRSGRKHMARRWLGHLQKHYPILHQRALQLNQMDGWKWQFDPVKEARRQKKQRALAAAPGVEDPPSSSSGSTSQSSSSSSASSSLSSEPSVDRRL